MLRPQCLLEDYCFDIPVFCEGLIASLLLITREYWCGIQFLGLTSPPPPPSCWYTVAGCPQPFFKVSVCMRFFAGGWINDLPLQISRFIIHHCNSVFCFVVQNNFFWQTFKNYVSYTRFHTCKAVLGARPCTWKIEQVNKQTCTLLIITWYGGRNCTKLVLKPLVAQNGLSVTVLWMDCSFPVDCISV